MGIMGGQQSRMGQTMLFVMLAFVCMSNHPRLWTMCCDAFVVQSSSSSSLRLLQTHHHHLIPTVSCARGSRCSQHHRLQPFLPARTKTAALAAAAAPPTLSAAATTTMPASFLQTWGYMVLLAFQFGAQPLLTRRFTPKTIARSSVVLAQEVVKFCLAALLLVGSGSWAASVAGWSVSSWWIVAGIPAALYVVQNYCALIAYQNLSPVTFNVLNQTKTLSAALCCYLVMGRMQSKIQIVSLHVLLLAALVIENVVPLPKWKVRKKTTTATAAESTAVAVVESATTSSSSNAQQQTQQTQEQEKRKMHIIKGVIPVLMASFLSGLAGALSQKSLQNLGRNSYLFTMELSAASSLFLTTSLLLRSPDGKRIARDGFFFGWTWQTCLPVLTNALGGILVGLVTKYAGSVRKGFALIFGLLLSGILQSQWSSSSSSSDDVDEEEESRGVTPEQVVGGLLAAVSLWMHSSYPVVVTKSDQPR